MGRVKTAEEIDEQIARLKARKQQILQQQRQRERKQRNHALMVLGGMVESACGGDWKSINYYDLDEYLHQWSKAMKRACLDQADTADDANAHVREFESWKRDMARQEREETARIVDEVLRGE